MLTRRSLFGFSAAALAAPAVGAALPLEALAAPVAAPAPPGSLVNFGRIIGYGRDLGMTPSQTLAVLTREMDELEADRRTLSAADDDDPDDELEADGVPADKPVLSPTEREFRQRVVRDVTAAYSGTDGVPPRSPTAFVDRVLAVWAAFRATV